MSNRPRRAHRVSQSPHRNGFVCRSAHQRPHGLSTPVQAHEGVPLSSWIPERTAKLVLFWGFFLLLWFVVRLIRKRFSALMKWERVHWIIQSAGLVCGGLRGLWWAGFILVALSSSGFTYLRQSVEERSLLGPQLLRLSRDTLRQVADRFPGAISRGTDLVPPVVKPSGE